MPISFIVAAAVLFLLSGAQVYLTFRQKRHARAKTASKAVNDLNRTFTISLKLDVAIFPSTSAQGFVGFCPNFLGGLTAHGSTQEEAFEGIIHLVIDRILAVLNRQALNSETYIVQDWLDPLAFLLRQVEIKLTLIAEEKQDQPNNAALPVV